MISNLLAAPNLTALRRAALLAGVAVLAVGVSMPQADAAPRKRGERAYTQRGPNVSYQSGPRTRIYVTKRSWLDAGTEVLRHYRRMQAATRTAIAADVAAVAVLLGDMSGKK